MLFGLANIASPYTVR